VRTRSLFKNQRQAVLVGFALWGAGLWVLYDAYERSGRPRPYPAKFAGPPLPLP
jgi:hypothetical protein